MRGNNKYGRGGKRGVPAPTIVAFLDHYTYTTEGARPQKRINGRHVIPSDQRQIRRWRNGETDVVNAERLATFLVSYGFEIAWFHQWAKKNKLPIVVAHSPSAVVS